ncbi:VOC family protein [Myxococcus sp. CA051A]|uniref:VOC family protein n=1 Tax=unclassified Myxococcus TaxID=2648731 RepID=UPI00157A7275|nr:MULTISPECIES: VOC family protein [unclassified Myxococcus]NTX01916.1 VOC family protein [Myxococcus sp. CA040A]NTX14596.1 VOC family protein [Myxococcus sp. CA056]NTX38744.1 VOC family protein [Myxococcus sp. CA033]NTX56870.1 VOC family protein [Myxococcus sp. CA039A]NTX62691.1 VOC family protein [Myxococcus sp. CA051A]
MNVQGFHHVAIQAWDIERVTAFYRDLLGFPELTRHPRPDGTLRSIWVGVPGGGFLAIEAAGAEPEPQPFRHPGPGLLMLAFRIARAERDAVVSELTQAGVPLEHETRWTVYVRDPEGNRVALSHHPED